MLSLLVATSAIPSGLYAQADFWTIFGINGCSSGTQTNRMTTQISPAAASLTGTPNIEDETTPSTVRYYMQNSMYDKAGQLLFTVNRNGIYNPDGTTAYDFMAGTYTATVTVGGIDHICTPTYAASEIVIFPVTKRTG